MFYSHLIISDKKALGKIWLAAHFEKKLTKAQVFDTNIEESCDAIIHPRAPMALRLSGHLLLGVARIYGKKVDFLFVDCNDALAKLKMAFRPEVSTTAPISSITLPEVSFEDHEVDDVFFSSHLDLPGMAAVSFNLKHTARDAGETLLSDNLTESSLGDFLGGADATLDELGQSMIEQVRDDDISELYGGDEIPSALGDISMGAGEMLGGAEFPGDGLGGADAPFPESFQKDITQMDVDESLDPLTNPVAREKRKRTGAALVDDLKSHVVNVQKNQEEVGEILSDEIALAPPTKRRMLEDYRTSLAASNPLEALVLDLPPDLRELFALPEGVESLPPDASTLLPSFEDESRAFDTSHLDQRDIEIDRGEYESGGPGDISGLPGDISEIPEILEGGKDEIGFDPSEIEGSQFGMGDTEADKTKQQESWSKYTGKVRNFLEQKFKENSSKPLSFNKVTRDITKRSAVAGMFFELLVLKNSNSIDVAQEKPYGDIFIHKTEEFDRRIVS